MIKNDIKSKNKSIDLILPTSDNNCKVKFWLLLSILLYI